MGTRSLTHFKESGKNSATLCTIYRQFDGYLEGHGKDMAEIIAPRKLVNGYNDPKHQTNGTGCLAALVIAGLKGNQCGNVYIQTPDASDCGEEFTYTVYAENGIVMISCPDAEFEGTAQELLNSVVAAK